LTPFFWRRFRARASCKSGTGFVCYQIPAPIRTPFYSKPESNVHVTESEMMIYDLFLLFNLPLAIIIAASSANSSSIRRFQPRLFLAPEIFIPDVYGVKYRRRKSAPENRVDLWLRFLERVSWV